MVLLHVLQVSDMMMMVIIMIKRTSLKCKFIKKYIKRLILPQYKSSVFRHQLHGALANNNHKVKSNFHCSTVI